MIAQTIQLALAPVFLLVAMGNIMNILSQRLARVVDRSRHLQQQHVETKGADHDRVVREIRVLDQRIHLITRSITLLVLTGLTIGLCVALLFVEELLHVSLQQVAGAVFFLAIMLLMSALWLFLREVRVATAALRVPEMYLERERTL
ncbi:MAG: DUF2721 domain-containing protein [Croceibacterium sp.]